MRATGALETEPRSGHRDRGRHVVLDAEPSGMGTARPRLLGEQPLA